MEIWEKNRKSFYSYTYKVKNRKNNLVPLVRWDNFEKDPHVDKYDENTGALLEGKVCMEKELKEVIKVVTVFRKNLRAMEVSDL